MSKNIYLVGGCLAVFAIAIGVYFIYSAGQPDVNRNNNTNIISKQTVNQTPFSGVTTAKTKPEYISGSSVVVENSPYPISQTGYASGTTTESSVAPQQLPASFKMPETSEIERGNSLVGQDSAAGIVKNSAPTRVKTGAEVKRERLKRIRHTGNKYTEPPAQTSPDVRKEKLRQIPPDENEPTKSIK